jgi:phosphinothricin acetyltransferase
MAASTAWFRIARTIARVPTELLVRAAAAGDADRIAAIYAHYVATTPATFDEVAPDADAFVAKIATLGAAGWPFLVAEEHGAPAGYAYLAPHWERSAYRHTVEDSVYVAPEARGRGIGRALLERLLADGERAGAREVIATIAATEGEASVALHRACGFREAGRLEAVGLKHGAWHDTILMQRSLRPAGAT